MKPIMMVHTESGGFRYVLPALRGLLVLIFVFALQACSSSYKEETESRIKAAEQLMVDLRDKLSKHQYADIYKSSSVELKKMSGEGDFIKFMNEISRNLGALNDATLQRGDVQYGSIGGPIILLTYQSKYSNSAFVINEVFIFIVEDGEVKFAGYRYHLHAALLHKPSSVPM